MLRRFIPRTARHVLRDAHRTFMFAWARRKLVRDPLAAAESTQVLAALIYGWGNEGFSAEYEYLRHMIRSAWHSEAGDVLECGSGLSTLALAAVAKHRGTHVIALEHIDAWARRVRKALADAGLSDHATIRLAPLVSYGLFAWYADPPLDRTYALAVCDGPPSTTQGGRYGLWPVMRGSFAPGATVLLDDLERPAEQNILREWTAASGGLSHVHGATRPFGELRLPAAKGAGAPDGGGVSGQVS